MSFFTLIQELQERASDLESQVEALNYVANALEELEAYLRDLDDTNRDFVEQFFPLELS